MYPNKIILYKVYLIKEKNLKYIYFSFRQLANTIENTYFKVDRLSVAIQNN